MRDMHCHILPGVDDGSSDLQESLAMLEAAKRAGITSIVCTPHCRDPYFDYDAMWHAYYQLREKANGFPISMGFEVNHRKLMDLGMEWAPRLGLQGTNQFLLELSTHATKYDFQEYENTIYQLQSMGFEVVIAHPERYHLIQEDIEVARDLVRMGCKLQASTDFIAGGRFGKEKKPAKKLLEAGLYTYFASDAHFVKHYDYFKKAFDKFGDRLPEEAYEDAPQSGDYPFPRTIALPAFALGGPSAAAVNGGYASSGPARPAGAVPIAAVAATYQQNSGKHSGSSVSEPFGNDVSSQRAPAHSASHAARPAGSSAAARNGAPQGQNAGRAQAAPRTADQAYQPAKPASRVQPQPSQHPQGQTSGVASAPVRRTLTQAEREAYAARVAQWKPSAAPEPAQPVAPTGPDHSAQYAAPAARNHVSEDAQNEQVRRGRHGRW